jgi:hypothetical protein
MLVTQLLSNSKQILKNFLVFMDSKRSWILVIIIKKCVRKDCICSIKMLIKGEFCKK